MTLPSGSEAVDLMMLTSKAAELFCGAKRSRLAQSPSPGAEGSVMEGGKLRMLLAGAIPGIKTFELWK
jgi:hypothetical protein